MKSVCTSVLLLTFTTVVSASGHETPQQVVTKYNDYKTICTGLGYQNVRCGAKNKDIVAFQTSHSASVQNLKNHENLVFDKVLLNEGKAYNKSTGKFTATTEGVYLFIWTILSKAGSYFVSEIVHNGNPKAYNYCDGRGRNDGYAMSSTQSIMKLKKGDSVWIRAYGNHGVYAVGGEWCTFSGFKM